MGRKVSFWASVFFIFFCILIIVPIVGALADDGTIRNIWLDVLEVFPFGGMLGELVVRIFSKALGQYIDVSEYLSGNALPGSAIMWMQEILKLCMTGIFYGALTAVVDQLIKVKKTSKGWAGAERVLWHMFCTLLASVLCGLIFQFLYSQINQLSSQAARIWTDAIMFLVTGGGIVVYILLLGTLGKALIYVIIKLVLLNTLNAVLSYSLLLMILLCLSEKSYLLLAGSIGAWGVLIVLLIGIDIMLSSVLEK